MTPTQGVLFVFLLFGCSSTIVLGFAVVLQRVLTGPSAEKLAAMETTGRAYIDGMIPSLAPWEPGSLEKLAGIRGKETLGFDSRAMFAWTWYGWVRSAADGRPLAAFALYRRARVTQVIARTSAMEWRMEGRSGHGQHADLAVATFHCDGELLGRWQPADGHLIDGKGQRIAIAKRPPDTMKGGALSYDVTVDGEVAARVRVEHAPIPSPRVQSDEPLLEVVNPAVVDERWLFSIAMVESAYFTVMRVRRGIAFEDKLR